MFSLLVDKLHVSYIRDLTSTNRRDNSIPTQNTPRYYMFLNATIQNQLAFLQFYYLPCHTTFVCLFDLILYVPSTIFQLNRDGSSWVEPVLMPRLHLLRSSCDLFVYDFFGIVGGYKLRRLCLHYLRSRLHLLRSSCDLFVYDFFGIVGGYKLRRLCLHYLRSPYDFFRRQTRTKPYRDLVDIVRQQQGYRTIIVLTSQIAQCPYDDLAEVARSRYPVCAIVI